MSEARHLKGCTPELGDCPARPCGCWCHEVDALLTPEAVLGFRPEAPRPFGPSRGMKMHETDTGVTRRFTGKAWRRAVWWNLGGRLPW